MAVAVTESMRKRNNQNMNHQALGNNQGLYFAYTLWMMRNDRQPNG